MSSSDSEQDFNDANDQFLSDRDLRALKRNQLRKAKEEAELANRSDSVTDSQIFDSEVESIPSNQSIDSEHNITDIEQDISTVEMAEAATAAAKLAQLEARLKAMEDNRANLPPQAQPQASVGGENLFPAGSAIRPTIFKGGYNPTFSQWLCRFEEICLAHKWQGDRRAEILQLFLDGGARLAYRALPDDVKKDYALLKTELLKTLEPVESSRFFSQLLYGPKARKLQAGETVSSFAADIMTYTQQAHPVTDNFPAEAQNQIMREAFISGLPNAMKSIVLDKEPSTFEEALSFANKLEARNFLLKGDTPNEIEVTPPYHTFAINSSQYGGRQNFQRSNASPNNFKRPQFRQFRNTKVYNSNQQRFSPNSFSNPKFLNQRYNTSGNSKQSLNFQRSYPNYHKPQQFRSIQWCSYHKVNTHNTVNCRSLANRENANTMQRQNSNLQSRGSFLSKRPFFNNYNQPSSKTYKPVHTVDISSNILNSNASEISEPFGHSTSSFQHLSDNLNETNKKIAELEKNLKITQISKVHEPFQVFPIDTKFGRMLPLPPPQSTRLCMFHTYGDFKQLASVCRADMRCPYGHKFLAIEGRALCSETRCPSRSLCAVCCHTFDCIHCGSELKKLSREINRAEAASTPDLTQLRIKEMSIASLPPKTFSPPELTSDVVESSQNSFDSALHTNIPTPYPFKCSLPMASASVHTDSPLPSRPRPSFEPVETENVLKFKRLSNYAYMPSRETSGSAGLDLYAAYHYEIKPHGKVLCLTDLAIELPPGTYGRIAPKSKLAHYYFIDTGAGVIDNDFRGNIGVLLFNFGEKSFVISPGDKIAQLIVEKYSYVALCETDKLSSTVRNTKGIYNLPEKYCGPEISIYSDLQLLRPGPKSTPDLPVLF